MVRVKGEIIALGDSYFIHDIDRMAKSPQDILDKYRSSWPAMRIEWLTGPKVTQLSVAEINRANGQPELL